MKNKDVIESMKSVENGQRDKASSPHAGPSAIASEHPLALTVSTLAEALQGQARQFSAIAGQIDQQTDVVAEQAADWLASAADGRLLAGKIMARTAAKLQQPEEALNAPPGIEFTLPPSADPVAVERFYTSTSFLRGAGGAERKSLKGA